MKKKRKENATTARVSFTSPETVKEDIKTPTIISVNILNALMKMKTAAGHPSTMPGTKETRPTNRQ